MPRHCSAAGCKSRDTRETRKAGITFHRLPKRGKPRRTLWILNSRRTGPQGKGQWDPQSQFIYFCSKHFTPESFELSGVSGYRRLKEDALPTVFETLPRQRRTATERSQRGASKQVARRRTRRQSNSLKQEKEEPDPQAGACPNTGGGASAEEMEKTEEPGWEENELRREGAARIPEQTLPPAASPLPSSPLPPSPGPSLIFPPSALPAPPLPRPSEGPPPPPSVMVSSLPPSGTTVLSPSSVTPSPPPSETASSRPPPTPPLPARPPSPSRYMRRLPPPPGFYLPREHSYAQLCPLVWKKRYDKAIDSLEKSVRLLNAARRREARLRQTLLWLRETRVRPGPREGCRGRPASGQGPGAREAGPPRRGIRLADEPRDGESEAERLTEDLGLVEAGLADTGEWGGWASPPPTKTGPEEDPGFCFYCGRGQGEGEGWDVPDRGAGEGRARGRLREPRKGGKDNEEEEEEEEEAGGATDMEECCYYYYCEDGEGQAGGREADLHVVTLEQAVLKSQGAVCLPDPAPRGPPRPAALPRPAERPLQATLQLQALQPVQLLQPQQGAASLRGAPVTVTEGGGGAEQRLFWVQEGAEGRLLLLPMPAEEDDGGGGGGATGAGVEVTVEAAASGQALQALVVSAAGFPKSAADEGEGPGLGGGAGMPRTKGRGESEAETRSMVASGDIRERLKEHLEGFQLQLSNEFIH